jgi:hypothetical protein
VTDFLAEEYEYLRESEGRDIFLALAPYVKALEGQAEVREVLTTLQAEAQQALQRFAAEQNDLIEEAKAIRRDLAKEATEIDNSDMKEPDRASQPTRHGTSTASPDLTISSSWTRPFRSAIRSCRTIRSRRESCRGCSGS